MATTTWTPSTPLGRIYYYARPYLWMAALSILCVFITNGFSFTIPWLIKRCIDLMRERDAIEIVPTYAGLIIAAAVGMGLTRWASRVAIFDFNRSVEKDLRSGLFAHIQRMHPTFLQEMPSGDILSRATNDLNQVRMAIGMGAMLGFNTLTAYVGSIGMLLYINWHLALWAILPYPLIILIIRAFGRSMHVAFLAAQESLATMSTHLQESYGGHHVVQAYTREGHEIEVFKTLNEDYVEKNMAAVRRWGMMYPMMATIGGVGSLIVLWVGGRQVIAGQMSLGDFVAFNSYLGMLVWPSMALGWVMNLIQRGASAMQRIEALFAHQPAIADPLGVGGWGLGAGEMVPRIEFRHFTFAYPRRSPASDREQIPAERNGQPEAPTPSPQPPAPVLQDISLTIEPGETVAIMGLIGAGKSTLIQALPRLIEVAPGQVFVGGEDVTRWPLARLRALISFVPQDAFLFSTTLADNIAYGGAGGWGLGVREASHDNDHSLSANGSNSRTPEAPNPQPPAPSPPDEVRHWARIAHLDEDVAQFPQGYETAIGERGVTLSGGQRQRATIARALFLRAPIVIFDDSFSSIDTGTEWAILEDMRRELSDRTVLLVTHRVSTAQKAGRIVVLEEGRITDIGTHAELLARGGLYARLYRQQQLVREVEAL